jgi:purine-nucleoside phosphorylase
MIDNIRASVKFLQKQDIQSAEIGVILGTGLGNLFVQQMQNQIVIDYSSIPHFPVSTVESHHGKLIYGNINGKTVLAMQGRFHFYEGYNMQEITMPVRVMKMLGVKFLLISNAAGSLNRSWKKGELMLLDDHISLQSENPLRGKNDERLGPRFPDMSAPYSKIMNEKLSRIAREKNIQLNKGVYVAVMGPNLETRAEYRFLRIIGADAVGMSTVPEVIVANHAGVSCCAVSVLTDDCDPDNLIVTNIDEIIAVARRAEPQLTSLFVSLISEL